ncbi:hypothetical protein WAK64_17010 [Bacillus spongiae]|uniref:Haem-binding uptake Tiki superfamily ChaN domain-containing protein n=1 Tax=Bacillus spongiae TaxID=2683610 RepID=A0ABU8HHZ9_9BACI
MNLLSNTVVGILGTVHTEDLRSKFHYSLEKLEEKILEFNPDIICGEIRPEDWEKHITTTDYTGYLGPNEYRQSIIPLCERNQIKFVPVDWFEWDIVNLDHFEAYPKEEQMQLHTELTNMYNEIFLKVNEGNTPFNSLEVDQLVKEKHDWLFKVNADVQNLTWQARNQLMIIRINNVIKANRNKRILCTVGMEHNYYYYSELQKTKGIQLCYPL